MYRDIFSTRNDWTGLILRLTLGLVLFPHGAQKLFGWFGGYGFEGTMHFFTDTVQVPWIVGFLVIIIESFGALLLVFGVGARLMAIGIFGVMTGVLLTSHIQHGFFMNWYGNASGEGAEFDLLCLGLAAAIVVNGAGRFSADNWIYRKLSRENNSPGLQLQMTATELDLG